MVVQVVSYKGPQPRRCSSLNPALAWTLSARGRDLDSYTPRGDACLLICTKTVYTSKDHTLVELGFFPSEHLSWVIIMHSIM